MTAPIRMQELDRFASEPGFCVKYLNAPVSELDFQVTAWAIEEVAFMRSASMPEEVQNMRFDLPYNYGPGWLLLEKVPEITAQFMWAAGGWSSPEEGPWGWRTPESNALGTYTGWCLTDGYADSMTNLFWSPIFVAPGNAGTNFGIWAP